MRGVILRDALVLHKRYLRRASIAVLIASVAGTLLMRFAMSSVLSIVLPMGVAALTANLFAEDERDGWADYLKTMPISTSRIIGARYLVSMGAVVLCAVYSLAMSLLAYLLFGEQVFQLYIILPGIGLAVSILNVLLLLPSCYAFGASGANAVSLGILLAVSMIVFAIQRIDVVHWVGVLASMPQYIFWVGAAALLAVFCAASFFLSKAFFNRRRA